MTDIAAERSAQQRWTARLRRPAETYDVLLEREFEDPERRIARNKQTLSSILRFACQHVPFYRGLFKQIGADPNDPEVFSKLPILRKLDLRDNESAFHAERLPEGEKVGSEAKSTGTTGMPVRVRHTIRSDRMFAYLKQREYRWFRFNPGGTLAVIRTPRTLVKHQDGRLLAEGEEIRMESWPGIGQDFSTGPAMAFSLLNPPEHQIAWLRHNRPDHLMAFSHTIEHLAFTAGDQIPCTSLKGVLAIAEQVTPDMRAHAERSFGVPVEQNYGLNEIGLVAGRCEAGRYHVHSENALVEIVRDDGSAAAPGETGRVVVTGLSNLAMPMIRYDADDLARAVDGPCACGRTLPSFGDIVGRYSRFASLPARSFTMLDAVRVTILKMPPHEIRDIRQFQLHQFRDGHYELRLLVHAPLPDAFTEQVQSAWAKVVRSPEQVLVIRYVDEIERSPGGKYQVFTSDFMPAPDRALDAR